MQSPEALAPPDVEFKRPTVADVWAEARVLMQAHYKEVGILPIDLFHPDRDRYVKMDEYGLTKLFTMRVSGRLSGYCLFLLVQHLHCPSTVWAQQDALYVRPEFRGERAMQFIIWQDMQLRHERVDIVRRQVTDRHDYARTLESIGYRRVDGGHMRILNEDLAKRVWGEAA